MNNELLSIKNKTAEMFEDSGGGEKKDEEDGIAMSKLLHN